VRTCYVLKDWLELLVLHLGLYIFVCFSQLESCLHYGWFFCVLVVCFLLIVVSMVVSSSAFDDLLKT